MTAHSDLIAELRALADCDSRAGEPLGKCMRRAADKIERLAEHVDYIEAQWLAKDAALSSQSLSLSEAREEIERLTKERDDYRERWKSSSNNVARVCGTASRLRDQRDEAAVSAYEFVAGWHERQAKLFREMAEDDPRTAKPARDRAKEAAIHHAASAAALRNRAADDRRAALVSGSREDGASLLRTIETLPDDFTDDGNCCAGKLKEPRP